MHQLGFEASGSAAVRFGEFQGESLENDGAGGELPLAFCNDRLGAGDGDGALCCRAVVPGRRGDVVGGHTGGELVGGGRGEQTGLAEPSRKSARLASLGIRSQSVDGAAGVVHQQQVVGSVVAEADDP